jgi:hypothetical protein
MLIPSGADVVNITNVRFQYGTDLSEPHFDGDEQNPVPAPPAIILLATAIPFLGLRRLLRRKVA